jgi:hypothetical protein
MFNDINYKGNMIIVIGKMKNLIFFLSYIIIVQRRLVLLLQRILLFLIFK